MNRLALEARALLIDEFGFPIDILILARSFFWCLIGLFRVVSGVNLETLALLCWFGLLDVGDGAVC